MRVDKYDELNKDFAEILADELAKSAATDAGRERIARLEQMLLAWHSACEEMIVLLKEQRKPASAAD